MTNSTNRTPATFSIREVRLKKRRDFLRIQKYGVRAFGAFVVVVAERATDGLCKFGITVPKKVGNSVARNLMKRRIRHIIGDDPALIERQHIVVIVKESAVNAQFSQLKGDIETACRRVVHRFQETRQRPKKVA